MCLEFFILKILSLELAQELYSSKIKIIMRKSATTIEHSLKVKCVYLHSFNCGERQRQRG